LFELCGLVGTLVIEPDGVYDPRLINDRLVLVIHWAGGRHTEVRARRPKSGEHGRRTDTEALEITKQMAGQFPNELIAATLDRLGLKRGAGNPWKKNRVCSLRNKLNLPTYDPAAPTTTVTAAQAAQRLGIDARMVHELLRQKVIQGRQIVPYAPWQIPVEALDSPVCGSECGGSRKVIGRGGRSALTHRQ